MKLFPNKEFAEQIRPLGYQVNVWTGLGAGAGKYGDVPVQFYLSREEYGAGIFVHVHADGREVARFFVAGHYRGYKVFYVQWWAEWLRGVDHVDYPSPTGYPNSFQWGQH